MLTKESLEQLSRFKDKALWYDFELMFGAYGNHVWDTFRNTGSVIETYLFLTEEQKEKFIKLVNKF